jgi:hypothetical protein
MTFMKRRIAAALAVIGIASLVTFLQVEANHETEDQIGDEAVWNATDNDLSAIHQACKNSEPAGFNNCFTEQMGGYASSDAVAFTQQLAVQKASRPGYLAGMHESGLVDIGYVVYPENDSPHQGWVLLNGIPAIVNVDDVARLPRLEMEKSAEYIALRQSNPRMQLVVSDEQRKADSLPQIDRLAEGGERFVIPYALQESCPGCAAVAQARFGFDFNNAGKFIGIKFLGVQGGR